MEINVFIRFDEFTMFDFLGKKMMGFNEKRKILCWKKMMMKKKLIITKKKIKPKKKNQKVKKYGQRLKLYETGHLA